MTGFLILMILGYGSSLLLGYLIKHLEHRNAQPLLIPSQIIQYILFVLLLILVKVSGFGKALFIHIDIQRTPYLQNGSKYHRRHRFVQAHIHTYFHCASRLRSEIL